jgi:AcrR family transcriptional regulator/predicted DNA-binding transcriptional regulator AlpA
MRAYTISELVALTGVPPATVHHYLREGMFPRPKRLSSNRYVYDQRHLQALKLIRRLREQRGLPLPMIRQIMPELLALEDEDAFRPEMWDRALAPRLARRRPPAIRLLNAAKAAFARRGYAEVNVDDICRAARIAKGSFYRHHRSKEELFFAAAESLASDAVTLFLASIGSTKVDFEDAAVRLAPLIRPGLPLFLDLVARAVQGRPGHVEAARAIFGTAAAQVGQAVSGSGLAEDRGARALGAASQLVFLTALRAPARRIPSVLALGASPAAPRR